MDTRRIVIPGGSGFIGDYISRYFVDKGYEVVVLSRAKTGVKNGIQYVVWDAVSIGEWAQYIDGAYAVINLTGRSINCRFTQKNKSEIIDSRVDSVHVLLQACSRSKVSPAVFIQASSVGYYGNTDKVCVEKSSAGSDFLAKVCTIWENTFWALPLPSTRKIVFRFGVVLNGKGGAMERMLPWVRWYLGGKLGCGNQQISWIHLEDLSRMFEFTLNNATVEGTYNATSDHPVSNADFMSTLRKVLSKPWAPPVPAFLVRIAAFLFMGTDAGVLLHGAACSSKKIQDLGYIFKYPYLREALLHLLK